MNRWLSRLRSLVRSAAPTPIRAWVRRLPARSVQTSARYEVVQGAAAVASVDGWLEPSVAARQSEAFAPVLAALRSGRPRADFAALAEAVRLTGLVDPLILEVGCGGGWNGEVLERLLVRPVRYFGLDYAPAMVERARQDYPGRPFLVGDGTALPVATGAVDVLLSGTVLMHIPAYAEAIGESRRAARAWCIFHTVPILQTRSTTILRKEAYGQPVAEVILNEGELLHLLSARGLTVRHVLPSLPYNLAPVLGEPTVTKTYVCEIMG